MLQLVLPIWAIFSLSLLIPYCIAYTPLSDETIKNLPDPGTDFDISDGALLAPILRPRVPGTSGSEAVQQHFIDFFQDNLPKWKLELHNSTSKTPTSDDEEIPFVNVIATRDPPRSKPGEVSRLTLVAHYDSKSEPEGFIGAIDSAAPCAMLLHVARSLDGALTRMWEENSAIDGDGLDADKGIQILFTDGEEAFEKWSERDSLYGARYGRNDGGLNDLGLKLIITQNTCEILGTIAESGHVDVSQRTLIYFAVSSFRFAWSRESKSPVIL